MKKRPLVLIIVTILISNNTPLNYLLKENYLYSNIDGSFTFVRSVGRDSTLKAQ